MWHIYIHPIKQKKYHKNDDKIVYLIKLNLNLLWFFFKKSVLLLLIFKVFYYVKVHCNLITIGYIYNKMLLK